ncbi:MAG: CHASE2 domain-containing protein, partial [Merismopedia sp. SIO2A8]|nr:CHASE2 domain-containing protein [Merismopedia sp. SIO2A8]
TSIPVYLIAIDQKSLKKAQIETYEVDPISREYLAKMVQKLSNSNAGVVGLNYSLNGSSSDDQLLNTSFINAINQQVTWFVFVSHQYEPDVTIEVTDRIASPQWKLQGEGSYKPYPFWEVIIPKNDSCQANEYSSCSFAYMLALARQLRNNNALSVNLPRPQIEDDSKTFQSKLLRYSNQKNTQGKNITFLKERYTSLGFKQIIDFSIPPDQIYKNIAAWQFLQLPSDSPELQELDDKVVIIAPGGYQRAKDNYHIPLAINNYWRRNRDIQKINRKWFTSGEAHAYMTHHLLSEHIVILIPPLLLIATAAFLGKTTNLILHKQYLKPSKYLTRLVIGLILSTTAYGVVGLQAYIWFSVLFTWFLPSATFCFFVMSNPRK